MNLKLRIVNLGADVDASAGESVADVYARIAPQIPFAPVCCRVNNKNEDLAYPIFAPKQIEFLGLAHPDGMRCYVRSLCLMLYRAVVTLYPGASLRMGNAVSGGYYFTLSCVEPTADNALAIKREMDSLVSRALPLTRCERPTEEVREMFRRQGLADKVKLLDTLADRLYSVYYMLDGIADAGVGPMAPDTASLAVFDIAAYEDGFLLMPPSASSGYRSAAAVIAQPKLFRAFTAYRGFNRIVGISTAADVNEAVRERRTDMMVNVAEALCSKYIREIADTVTSRFREGGAKVVLISGPSSSGKTTFTKRLAIELLTNLIKPVMISLDDYFVDRHTTPVDENGELDYESLYALDLELFNSHLVALTRGDEVELPCYNFEQGRREYKNRRIRLAPDAILLIEGIHGLNPELTPGLSEEMKYRIYVSALTCCALDEHNWVSTTDTRLLRRIIRDYKYRGTSPLDTIRRWPSVRRGEERWIFPYQENADSIFNSSLLFELSVMREEAERVLATLPRTCPEYATATRLRRLLSYFAPISTHQIPPTSLLREFLGGSSFRY